MRNDKTGRTSGFFSLHALLSGKPNPHPARYDPFPVVGLFLLGQRSGSAGRKFPPGAADPNGRAAFANAAEYGKIDTIFHSSGFAGFVDIPEANICEYC